MSFILTVIGALLLVPSVAGILVGAFMAADRNTRERGRLFALGWVPAVAAASGVLMRDAVTFVVGLLCFLVAGAVFILAGERARRSSVERRAQRSRVGESLGTVPAGSQEEATEEEKTEEQTTEEQTTEEQISEEDKPGGYGRAAS